MRALQVYKLPFAALCPLTTRNETTRQRNDEATKL